jgi:beta-phosphoglucomutase-like phosphatase (HAD superfamily)
MLSAQVDAYEYLEGMQALLQELRSAGVEMHAMSNYPQWYRRVDEKLGLHRRAPACFGLSSDLASCWMAQRQRRMCSL